MLCLVRTKACRRCGGDLSLARDSYGTYMEGIQCGASLSVSDLINSGTLKETEHRPPALTKAGSTFK